MTRKKLYEQLLTKFVTKENFKKHDGKYHKRYFSKDDTYDIFIYHIPSSNQYIIEIIVIEPEYEENKFIINLDEREPEDVFRFLKQTFTI